MTNMSSPSGSLTDLDPQSRSPKHRKLIVLLILITLSIVLIVTSIVRNEQKVVSLDTQQSLMLKKICEASFKLLVTWTTLKT